MKGLNIMSDYIVRAIACDKKIRAFAIDGKETVQFAHDAHKASAVATAALGRLLMGGAMMGVMMKGENDVLTITMKGDGPLGKVVVTADSHGMVKGFVDHPEVELPLNYAGKLDVGAGIGYGEMTVVKDLGLKEPYVSQVPLGTSEVAEDLTYYFYKSEQTPSSVALGVLVDNDCNVKAAGGFIIQLMPGADDLIASELEKRLENLKPVTTMLEEGMTPEDILNLLLEGFEPEFLDKVPVSFVCRCSKDYIARALMMMGKKELDDIIAEGKPINVNCHFCGKDYEYTTDELIRLRDGI